MEDVEGEWVNIEGEVMGEGLKIRGSYTRC